MSSQLLDLMENFLVSELSVGLSPDALEACDDVNPDQLELVLSYISDWDRGLHELLARPAGADSASPPANAADEARPFSAMFVFSGT
jgi:hypothetical protein